MSLGSIKANVEVWGRVPADLDIVLDGEEWNGLVGREDEAKGGVDPEFC